MTATSAAGSATTRSRDSLLRLAMRADAVLSGLAGVVALPLGNSLAELSGTTAAIEYAIAAFFIGYGVVVFGLAALPSVRRSGVVVIIANLAYTCAAVVVVVTDVWTMTTTGVVLTLTTGIYTLIFADLQYLGWRRLRG